MNGSSRIVLHVHNFNFLCVLCTCFNFNPYGLSLKKLYEQVQKTFCEKMGEEYGWKLMCTETTKSLQTRY